LAVLVVATPCPLIIAIPVAIIGAISLAARRGIVVKNPASLELISQCRTAIFDKTGTLTYGRPQLTHVIVCEPFSEDEVLSLAGSLERYSRHPLSLAIQDAARQRNLALHEAASINESPGQGLTGEVSGRDVFITGRKGAIAYDTAVASRLPAVAEGLECVVMIDGRYAALLRFHDEPRREGQSFIKHLQPQHNFRRIMLVSGDRESEVRYLAAKVGITEVYFSKTPEEKVEIVRAAVSRGKTVFLGDGINDAPALAVATVGVAIGQNSDVTAEAADSIILDTRLETIDAFLHIGKRMRRIALQSAVGGMAVSTLGMGTAAVGMLPPVAGAIVQELIDLLAVLNALRVSFSRKSLKDF
jgi:P-type E1-E2 ATPase